MVYEKNTCILAEISTFSMHKIQQTKLGNYCFDWFMLQIQHVV